jgi:hypothetical protein
MDEDEVHDMRSRLNGFFGRNRLAVAKAKPGAKAKAKAKTVPLLTNVFAARALDISMALGINFNLKKFENPSPTLFWGDREHRYYALHGQVDDTFFSDGQTRRVCVMVTPNFSTFSSGRTVVVSRSDLGAGLF